MNLSHQLLHILRHIKESHTFDELRMLTGLPGIALKASLGTLIKLGLVYVSTDGDNVYTKTQRGGVQQILKHDFPSKAPHKGTLRVNIDDIVEEMKTQTHDVTWVRSVNDVKRILVNIVPTSQIVKLSDKQAQGFYQMVYRKEVVHDALVEWKAGKYVDETIPPQFYRELQIYLKKFKEQHSVHHLSPNALQKMDGMVLQEHYIKLFAQ